MKTKIGTATCADCGYESCDVGLDKNQHPYLVCWGECDGEQFFTKGKLPKVRSLLRTFTPLPGKPAADELRAKYGLAVAPAADPPAPAPAPTAKKQSGLLIE